MWCCLVQDTLETLFHWPRVPALWFVAQWIDLQNMEPIYLLIFLAIFPHTSIGLTLREVLVPSACTRVCCKSRVEHLRCDWALLCKDLLIVHQGLFRVLLWLCANMKVERVD